LKLTVPEALVNSVVTDKLRPFVVFLEENFSLGIYEWPRGVKVQWSFKIDRHVEINVFDSSNSAVD